ncbi:C-type lectin domain family 4 member E-like [Mytilus edulis]|uniref:C-type lectin domain family 4 member E-like n=1 Tax=Mytilus edulis TaxID=6550 RepID=UPI0039F136B5
MTKFIEILLIAIGTFSNYCAGDIVVLRQTPHKIYIGNVVFETQAVSMWSLCAQLCSRMKICRSINFIQHNKTCQINNAEPEESTALLIDSYGDSFVAASTFPPNLASVCQDHNCSLDEICIPKSQSHICYPLFQNTTVHQTCPVNWLRLGSNCYYFSADTKTWHDAKAFCESENSMLAEVKTTTQMSCIKTVVKTYQKNYWLGGTDIVTEGIWIWIHSKVIITLNDWHPGQPDNFGNTTGEDCILMMKNFPYKWNDGNCHTQRSYICEKQLE